MLQVLCESVDPLPLSREVVCSGTILSYYVRVYTKNSINLNNSKEEKAGATLMHNMKNKQ